MLAERVVEWTKEWKQQGVQEGLQEGIKKGRKEGRQEGVKEGESTLLLRLLEHKFGKVSEKYHLIVQSADTDSLQEYAERVLTATTMSEIFEKR
ncbi:DUF4351 domain-containing protein [Candidatus Electrothrix sp.]|uniref:DUF4351 domain-containing protein n=1 Tax=Candidatus Electrothrix sp. TaxID=2170559 RepID=UPI004056F6A6